MVLLNNARPPRSPRRKGEKKMVAGSVHPLRDISWTAVMQNSSSGNRDILAKADKAENSTVELWGGPHSHHEESCQWGFAFGQTSVYKHGNQKLRNIVFFFFCWGFSEGLPPAADPACSVRAAVFDTGNSLRNEWFSILKSACHGSTYIIVTQNAAKLWLLSKRILNLNDVETTSWLPTGADRSRHSYTSSTSTGRACQVDEISYF